MGEWEGFAGGVGLRKIAKICRRAKNRALKIVGAAAGARALFNVKYLLQ